MSDRTSAGLTRTPMAVLVAGVCVYGCLATQPAPTHNPQCTPAADQLQTATASLLADSEVEYFGHRCRLGYDPECLRWCDARQHVATRFGSELDTYRRQCPGGGLPAGVRDTAGAFEIPEVCAVGDINGIRAILLRQRRGVVAKQVGAG